MNTTRVINYVMADMKQAYEDAYVRYLGKEEVIATRVYLAYEMSCSSHPSLNSKEKAKLLRKVIIDHYRKNGYHIPSVMKLFMNVIPSKYSVHGDYEPLTLE